MPTPTHALTSRPRTASIRRLLLGAGLSALLAAGIGAAAAPPASAAEAGVVVPGPTTLRTDVISALGVHWVRMFVTWPDIEPSRGVYAANWIASYEQAFHSLAPGTKVILDVVNTPRWETGSSNEHTAPAKPAEYAAFVAYLAQRWAGRVSAYEIWNEEDESRWWAGGANPAAYTELLKATYPAVKAADPKALVVLGGLTGNDYSFVEGVYQAGGKGFFDVVGVHTDTACDVLSPYVFLRGTDNRMIPDSFLAYREVHATMLANGDEKPIWMTEASWRTTGAVCSEGHWAGQKQEGVTDEQQATYLSQAYHCLAQDPYVQVALWFPLQDEGAAVSGLLRANGSYKPSFTSMQSFLQSGDQLTEPCGTTTGPTISVGSPTNLQRYEGQLPIHASATSPGGVWRIRLEMDGKLIRNFDDMGYPSTLSGAINWQGAKHISLGKHTLTLSAYDKEHNVSQLSVTVFHLANGSAARAHSKAKHHKSKKKKKKTRRHKLH
jgi:hypothetical protein